MKTRAAAVFDYGVAIVPRPRCRVMVTKRLRCAIVVVVLSVHQSFASTSCFRGSALRSAACHCASRLLHDAANVTESLHGNGSRFCVRVLASCVYG